MKLSIIAPTHGRPVVIKNFLESINKIKGEIVKPYEIIVVNNNNKILLNETSKVLKAFKLPVVEIKSKPLGSVKARNAGIKKASGEILCFFDDDTLVQKDYFKNLLKHYEDKSVGSAGGSEDKGRISFIHKLFFRFNKPGSINFFSFIVSNFSPMHKNSFKVKHLHGSNFSLRRSVAEEIGLMDELMKGHYRDETEYTYRVFEKGYDLIFEPRARVVHTMTNIGGNVSTEKKKEWAYWYHRNTSYLFFKHLHKNNFMRLILFLLSEFITSIIRSIIYKNFHYITQIRSIRAGYNLNRKTMSS